MRIRAKYIERLTITGKMKAINDAFDFCFDNGFHVTQSGPAPAKEKYKFDTTRYKIVAEREVEP